MKSRDNTQQFHVQSSCARMVRLSALACVGMALALPAAAQMYQWKDASGRTVVSDTPPPGAKARQIGKAAAASESPPPAQNGKEGDKKAETKKANPEREKADKAEQEKRELAVREYCDSARRRLAELDSGMRISAMDAKGERYFFTDEQRAAESAKLRQGMIDAKCP